MSIFGFKKKKKSEQPADDGYISIKEASEMLGVYQSTVRSWYDLGHLRGYVTPTGHRKVLKSSVEELLKRKSK